MSALLQLAGVERSFSGPQGPVSAVVGVDLALAAGEFLAISGPSGSGKSTLLLMAGGLLAPSAGSVQLAGQDCYRLSAAERAALRARSVGFVFQRFHLTPYLDLRDNIRAAALGATVADDEGRVAELAERFGLGARLGHRPAACSAGEQQRAALARALYARPQLLLADEPTGNLDRANAELVLDALVAFAEGGGAVLLVTHDERAAARAGRRVAMEDGSLSDAPLAKKEGP